MAGPLPDPAVPSEVYTEAYYRTGCMGGEHWSATEGGELDPLYPGYVRVAEVAAGEVVVDLGCGRGELLVAALDAGASRAIGIEYAEAAVRLARQTLAAHPAGERAELHHGDARSIPLGDDEADVVTLFDVVEHLTLTELQAALTEARRVLRPGGRLLVHTMPNRSIYTWTYRLQRLSRPGRRRRWKANPRRPEELAMHVNEMTVTALRRALRRAGFGGVEVWLGAWMYTEFVPDEAARRTYHRLAAHRLTARLGKGDLWARARA